MTTPCEYIAATEEGTIYCTLNAPDDYEQVKQQRDNLAHQIVLMRVHATALLANLEPETIPAAFQHHFDALADENNITEARERYTMFSRFITRSLEQRDQRNVARTELDALKSQFKSIEYAAHMPADYQFGLPSWINQHLYGNFIGVSISPHITAQIENGTLTFPNAPVAKELERIKELIRDYYREENFPTDQFIRLALGDTQARALGIVDETEETQVAIDEGSSNYDYWF